MSNYTVYNASRWNKLLKSIEIKKMFGKVTVYFTIISSVVAMYWNI